MPEALVLMLEDCVSFVGILGKCEPLGSTWFSCVFSMLPRGVAAPGV